MTASIRMDDLLMSTGAAFRGLAMPTFMDNTLQQANAIKEQGAMFGSLAPDLKAPLTATRDMGEVAARLLADASWTGQEDISVLGPDNLSPNDMAITISEVLGRSVNYQHISYEAFKARLAARGMSESLTQGYVDIMRAKNEGIDNAAAGGGTERTSTTFRQWCEDVPKPALSA